MDLPPRVHRSLIALSLALSVPTGQGSAQTSAPTGAPAREGFVVADDGARLFYRMVGTGRPVVIIPGGLFLERDLARLGEGRTLVFYDMRNRGRSETLTDSSRVSIGHDVRDLDAVRRHVGAEQVTLVGWSYLGMMVMRYAAAHPERVSRIVQIGPVAREFQTRFPDSLTARDPAPVPDSASVAELARLRAEGLVEREPRAFCEAEYRLTRARLVGDPKLIERVPDLCVFPNEWPSVRDRHFFWLFSSTFRDPAPAWDRFAELRLPVLVIHGTQDRNAPYGAGREWASHLPDARLVTVPGAAHLPWLDAPDTVFPAIERFLTGGWPADASAVRSR
jgi:pimeloyl-ACP methyl ester carboxylesterase